MNNNEFFSCLRRQITPATGCTEPIAAALAAAVARDTLPVEPKRAEVFVSKNIMKNAMGVSIPGTGMTGLSLAVALGVWCGDAEAGLNVLHRLAPDKLQRAEDFSKNVTVRLKDTPKKLYIEICLFGEEHQCRVTIEDSHTHITCIECDGEFLLRENFDCQNTPVGNDGLNMSIHDIYSFIENVDENELEFLYENSYMNWQIAEEGISKCYGLSVGRTMLQSYSAEKSELNVQNYAISMAAAAADARMSGSEMPVMTLCGSGNQGITATVPILALERRKDIGHGLVCKALALSCLLTIHIKAYIGRLSPICGCGLGSSIGVCGAWVYINGGLENEIVMAVKNMVADISGILCDGAKPGCALKIATVLSSAFQCGRLALNGIGPGEMDGIVSENVESTIHNLKRLGDEGMCQADRAILDIMICK